jgi:arsenite methyltransferase
LLDYIDDLQYDTWRDEFAYVQYGRSCSMSYKQASPETIKEQVRRYYAERIQSSSCCGSPSGCGGDAVPTEIALYGAEVIAALPSGVVTTSFGCGNPVALASLQRR